MEDSEKTELELLRKRESIVSEGIANFASWIEGAPNSIFLAGFCGKNCRYELKVGKHITAKELSIIVNKLRVDVQNMEKLEEEEQPVVASL